MNIVNFKFCAALLLYWIVISITSAQCSTDQQHSIEKEVSDSTQQKRVKEDLEKQMDLIIIELSSIAVCHSRVVFDLQHLCHGATREGTFLAIRSIVPYCFDNGKTNDGQTAVRSNTRFPCSRLVELFQVALTSPKNSDKGTLIDEVLIGPPPQRDIHMFDYICRSIKNTASEVERCWIDYKIELSSLNRSKQMCKTMDSIVAELAADHKLSELQKIQLECEQRHCQSSLALCEKNCKQLRIKLIKLVGAGAEAKVDELQALKIEEESALAEGKPTE